MWFGWEESIHLRCGYNQLGICSHVGMGSDDGIQLPECLGAAERAKAGNNSGCVLKGEKKNRLKEKLPFSCRASEGKTVEVPYKGDVENTILDILGGLRSTCTYVGAAKLKELSRRATFIRVTQQHNTVFS